MRRSSASLLWREWMLRVLDTEGGDSSVESRTVSLQAFVHPDEEEEARCLGFVSHFYGSPGVRGTCAKAPYGTGVFLNSTQDASPGSSQAWTMRQVGEGAFELVASSKPVTCLRFLAVAGCQAQPSLVTSATDSKTYTSWRLIKRYNIASSVEPGPSPSPSESPSESPSPSPSSQSPQEPAPVP